MKGDMARNRGDLWLDRILFKRSSVLFLFVLAYTKPHRSSSKSFLFSLSFPIQGGADTPPSYIHFNNGRSEAISYYLGVRTFPYKTCSFG